MDHKEEWNIHSCERNNDIMNVHLKCQEMDATERKEGLVMEEQESQAVMAWRKVSCGKCMEEGSKRREECNQEGVIECEVSSSSIVTEF